MAIFNNHDFTNKELFFVAFDYDQCMEHPFFKELYKIFRDAKNKYKGYPNSFRSYLHAAHKACAFYTMFAGREIRYNSTTYPEMFDIAFRYICLADSNENCDYFPRPEPKFFAPHEVFLIELLAYALLSVKNNPSLPHSLLEYYEDQISDDNKAERNIKVLKTLREPIPNNNMPSDRDVLYSDWQLTKTHFYDYKINDAIKQYNTQVNVDIRLHAYSWNIADWDGEDLAQWICIAENHYSQVLNVAQYVDDIARHFLHFWEEYSEKQTVVQAIEEWSKEIPQAFASKQLERIIRTRVNNYRDFWENIPQIDPLQLEADRAQAIKELYEYVEEVHKEVETAAEQTTAQVQRTNIVRLKLSKGKAANNNFINAVRVFNVLHELGFFANANGTPITKTDLFNALSNIFACPELTDWSNKLSSSRGQAAGSRKAQLKIFNTMLETQETILDDLDDKAEQRYR